MISSKNLDNFVKSLHYNNFEDVTYRIWFDSIYREDKIYYGKSDGYENENYYNDKFTPMEKAVIPFIPENEIRIADQNITNTANHMYASVGLPWIVRMKKINSSQQRLGWHIRMSPSTEIASSTTSSSDEEQPERDARKLVIERRIMVPDNIEEEIDNDEKPEAASSELSLNPYDDDYEGQEDTLVWVNQPSWD